MKITFKKNIIFLPSVDNSKFTDSKVVVIIFRKLHHNDIAENSWSTPKTIQPVRKSMQQQQNFTRGRPILIKDFQRYDVEN